MLERKKLKTRISLFPQSMLTWKNSKKLVPIFSSSFLSFSDRAVLRLLNSFEISRNFPPTSAIVVGSFSRASVIWSKMTPSSEENETVVVTPNAQSLMRATVDFGGDFRMVLLLLLLIKLVWEPELFPALNLLGFLKPAPRNFEGALIVSQKPTSPKKTSKILSTFMMAVISLVT